MTNDWYISENILKIENEIYEIENEIYEIRFRFNKEAEEEVK